MERRLSKPASAPTPTASRLARQRQMGSDLELAWPPSPEDDKVGAKKLGGGEELQQSEAGFVSVGPRRLLADQQAWEEAFPGFESMHNTIGRERGWPPYNRMRFQQDVGPEGAVYAGSPETVARKIATTVSQLGLTRFDMKFSTGTLSHAKMMRSIELYGTQVAPRVHELLAEAPATRA